MMYSNQDVNGWEIRSREGAVIEKGFPNYAKAAAKIREFARDIKSATYGIERSGVDVRRGVFFPVRSR